MSENLGFKFNVGDRVYVRNTDATYRITERCYGESAKGVERWYVGRNEAGIEFNYREEYLEAWSER